MLELVLLMKVGVVRTVGLDHLPNNFQPALAQTAQRAGVAFAFGPFVLIVNGRPTTLTAAAVGPQMHYATQVFVAIAAHPGLIDLPGLVTHRRGARKALESARIWKAVRIEGKLGQQARRQQRPGPRQGGEEWLVCVLPIERLDLLMIVVDLEL